jgi:RNA polymerase sigma factor (sigma-70 family)
MGPRAPSLLRVPWDEACDLPGDAEHTRAELADLSLFVLRLPPRERAAVVLRFWQQISETQIAATLGVTPRTVRNLLRRAYARLRNYYGEREGNI